MSFYRLLLRILFLLPPETAHDLVLRVLEAASFLPPSPCSALSHPSLERTFWGLSFPNPIGLAAGVDKNGVALPAWECLGFGFVEIGTVTPRPQLGNPKPRLFRVPGHQALVNRLGFPNQGAPCVRKRLEHLKEKGRWPRIPVGINIGKQKETPLEEATRDYVEAFRQLRELGDFFVLNVSSPNTPGLRSLQAPEPLLRLLEAIARDNRSLPPKPVLVKLSPDQSEPELQAICSVLAEAPCQGVVFCNTTLEGPHQEPQGGWSGAPLRERATRLLQKIASFLPPTHVLIGVGGILGPENAKERLAAGADLLELYTGLIYSGPTLPRRLCKALLEDFPTELLSKKDRPIRPGHDPSFHSNKVQ